MNNSEKLLSEKIDLLISLEHCFDVTSAEFVQIINNDFIQLEAE